MLPSPHTSQSTHTVQIVELQFHACPKRVDSHVLEHAWPYEKPRDPPLRTYRSHMVQLAVIFFFCLESLNWVWVVKDSLKNRMGDEEAEGPVSWVDDLGLRGCGYNWLVSFLSFVAFRSKEEVFTHG